MRWGCGYSRLAFSSLRGSSVPVAFPPVLQCCLDCRALAGGLLVAVLFVLSFPIDWDIGTLEGGRKMIGDGVYSTSSSIVTAAYTFL